jgi:hypothetical protein
MDEAGFGGSQMIRAAIFAHLGLEDRPFVDDRIAVGLDDGREDLYWYRHEKLKPQRDRAWMDPEFPWRARPVVAHRGDPRVIQCPGPATDTYR